MPQKISPFLWFDGESEEAAKFYVSIFPDSEILSVDLFPDGRTGDGTVKTVTFRLAGLEFVALDGGPEFKFNEAVSFSIDCKSQEEVDYYWDKLTAGGEPGPCGWLKDKYGLSWQVTPTRLIELALDRDRQRASRVMEAMLKMAKIDIPTLERAYAGD